jgi:hypothetical protein
MEAQLQSAITDVQRMDGGVFVSFGDGRNVFYSASLLKAMISQAQEIFAAEDED